MAMELELDELELSAWNHGIRELSLRKQSAPALQAFHHLHLRGLLPSKATYAFLISSFPCLRTQHARHAAARLYCILLSRSFLLDVVLGSALINMLRNCGLPEVESRRIFDGMPHRNVVTWTTMISSSCSGDESVHLFSRMLLADGIFPNKVTFLSLFRGCSSLRHGKRLHSMLLECGIDVDPVLCSSIVSMYGRCDRPGDARAALDRMKKRNVVLLTSVVSVYVGHGFEREARQMYHQMLQEGLLASRVTYVALLSACKDPGALLPGKLLHATVAMHQQLHSDVFLETALVSMYGKCGILNDAANMFDCVQQKNDVTWNALLAACKTRGKDAEAQQVYHQMLHEGFLPSKASFLTLSNALGNLGAVIEGRHLHAVILHVSEHRSDVEVHNSLISMYAKCGSIQESTRAFNVMSNRSVASWNTIIAAYAERMENEAAIQLFIAMWGSEGFVPDELTLTSILIVCGNEASLEMGRILHAVLVEKDLMLDAALATTLTNMYGKCGNIDDALYPFLITPRRDVVSWSSIIVACAVNGEGWEAIRLFNLMQFEAVLPNVITAVGVLLACSHAGLITEGLQCASSITQSGVKIVDEHVVCLIDILGRAGRVDEAELLLSYVSHETMVIALVMLLSFFRHEIDVVRAQYVAKALIEVDPDSAASYVLLSNVYMADDRRVHLLS